MATQELEAQVAEKEKLLAKVETRLAQTKGLLQVAEKNARAVEEKVKSAAMSATAQAIEKYKNSDAFEEDAAEAKMGAEAIGFDDCKAKVARNHPELDLSNIVANVATPEEEGGEEEGTRAIEAPEREVTMVEDPIATIGLDT